MIKFDFTNETKVKIGKPFFKKYVERLYKVLKPMIDRKLFKRDGNIELVLIGDKKMHEMNKEYRKKDSPTDVISFAYLEVTEYEKTEGDIIVADIFISMDTAQRQAKEKGHDIKKEMAILFVHGLLHVFGYGHETDEEEAEMEKWAKKILGN